MIVIGSVVLVLIVAAWLMWFMTNRSNPEPQFPVGSGVHTAENGPLPPWPVGDSDVRVQVNTVTSRSAEVLLHTPTDTAKTKATLAIGDTASLGDVTIRLCATWVNKTSQPLWDDSVGSSAYSDRIYYVFSTDGPAPACPQQVN